MTFSPSSATRMIAMPVGSSTSRTSRSTSASRREASASSAAGSAPTQPTMRTREPSRAAATAWFAPLPPGRRSRVAPVNVSPGLGRRRTLVTRSRLIEPTTVRLVSGSKCAQVDRRTLEVLAEIEQTGPERGTIRHRLDPSHVGEALQCAHEDGELEVGLSDAGRVHGHAGTFQHGLPLEQLAGTGPPVPGAAFRAIGLELEEIA